MGALCSAPGDAVSEEDQRKAQFEKKMTTMIDAALANDTRADNAQFKLLLLGPGESGKSTLFKQSVQLYGRGYPPESRLPYAAIIFTNVILGMQELLRQNKRLLAMAASGGAPAKGLEISEAIKGSADAIRAARVDEKMNPELARHIRTLWADDGVRATFDRRSAFQLVDSVRYFFERVDELGKSSYVPSYEDVLHCRARTTGIVETEWRVEGNNFRLIDVGGQRNERKKWIHCFENVTAVLFVAALNEYDMLLYEDMKTNRMHESLYLFEDVVNSRWFRETAVILFLNKRDLFSEKVKSGVPLTKAFPEYDGDQNEDDMLAFITREFRARNRYPETKPIYVHYTIGLSGENCRLVFDAVKDVVIRKRLKECGLLE